MSGVTTHNLKGIYNGTTGRIANELGCYHPQFERYIQHDIITTKCNIGCYHPQFERYIQLETQKDLINEWYYRQKIGGTKDNPHNKTKRGLGDSDRRSLKNFQNINK